MAKVLVLGSGGREHALVYRLFKSKSVSSVFCAPGSHAMSDMATLVNLPIDQNEAILKFAQENAIDLVLVGPETLLIQGIVDAFENSGIAIFGPDSKAAQLEGSKAYSKDFMKRYAIPTASYQVFSDYEKAKEFLASATYPTVIKASGLAAGKGVVIPHTYEEACQYLEAMMVHEKFGSAASSVVIEEFMEGEEFSLLVLCHHTTAVPLQIAQDYKRIFDGDEGENTGGMGAYTPVEHISSEDLEEAMRTVVHPTLEGMMRDDTPFTGVLFCGLMKTPEGIKTIEYNVRFGDPETESLMLAFESDLYEIIMSVLKDEPKEITWSKKTHLGVVLSAPNYPETPILGEVIRGMDQTNAPVFHMGTKFDGTDYQVNGGRVLFVSGSGQSLQEARISAYENVSQITSNGIHYRKDIGERMTLKFKGKTKDVYINPDKTITLKFKDDVTGSAGVFDPGANEVGLSIDGMGLLGLRVSSKMFEILKDVNTHFISKNLSDNTMVVQDCKPFGHGLEVICRMKAGGSFIRRYGQYISEGQDLDAYVEFTLKDDLRQDPLITEDGLIALNILTKDQYDHLKQETKRVAKQITAFLASKSLQLLDMKLEFGMSDGEIVLMDEISAGSMRVSDNGRILDPIELSRRILED